VDEAHFPHCTHLREDRQKGGGADGVTKRFGLKGRRHPSPVSVSAGVLRASLTARYSTTQVYLSAAFHLGEASIFNNVTPRIASAVTRVTPTV
jgi:hypothetical protein